MNLSELKITETGTILSISGKGATRQHLLDMGIIPGAQITLVKFAPMKDPIEFRIHGYSLTIRKDDAKNIKIEKSELINDSQNNITRNRIHPGLGESGYQYHDKKTENALPEDLTLRFALVGNQNAGKTTLFNQLTGSNQHAGNFPGVTVDRKDGVIRNYPNTLITDLPGIYSMSPYSPEEIVSRDFILKEKPHGIINVLDATSIERGLYLTMQLLELNIPMVLALNMMDEINDNDGYIDINGLEENLGIPVVAISAAKNQGIDELIEHAIHVAKYQEKPTKQDYCDPIKKGGVHRCLHSIMHTIEDHAIKADLPLRFCSAKCAEGDNRIIKMLSLTKNEVETIEHITKQMEDETGLDKAAAIADMRYSFILKVTSQNVIKPHLSVQQSRTNTIDKLLTGKYTAIPCFLAIMISIFMLTFEVFGPIFENMIESFINTITLSFDLFLTNNSVNPILHSLIIDGIFKGVGSILSFLPIIVILFFFLSIMEDSGYMARVAFVMDKLLRKIGLSGRSIVPLIIGFGCSVPAVMSARTLPSERDRKMTILLIPFMSCSAKLPIYGFFTAAFFEEHAGLAMSGLYLLSVIIGIVVALIGKNTLFKGEPVPFVMELPSYRIPSIKSVSYLLWSKAKDFLQKAFTIILMSSIVIWFLQNFTFALSFVTNNEDSMLAYISNFITPIFKPLGFADWRIIVSLICGFMAKEAVVSTLNVLFTKEALLSFLNPSSAFALLVFCVLYVPCIATINAIKKELGTKWAVFVAFFQCFIAYICAFLVHLIF